MWIEFTNVYGLPEGFRLEDVICAGCNSYEGAYSLMIKLSDGSHLVLLETRDKSKVLNLYTWLREKIKQNKVGTIDEDGTIIESNKGAYWND